jgi:site-specific DNA-cytosine methylase
VPRFSSVLSLFDGMSCGQIALNKAGIEYDNYFASEIDKHAIKVTQHNYPNTIQLGDVTKVIGSDLPKIDLLIGGSPCQGFSFIGKGLNFDDLRSKLFFEFVRLKNECTPTYFMIENVKMKKEYQDIISSYLGVEPIMINSNLVSAQNRIRLYWTNIPITELPIDRKIYLDDVIDNTIKDYLIPKNWELRVPTDLPKYVDPYNRNKIEKKSTSLRTNVNNGNMWVRVPNGYRNITRNEAEQLQTAPIGYTNIVSESQSKKMLGNGWTVDVIAHIFGSLLNGA